MSQFLKDHFSHGHYFTLPSSTLNILTAEAERTVINLISRASTYILKFIQGLKAINFRFLQSPCYVKTLRSPIVRFRHRLLFDWKSKRSQLLLKSLVLLIKSYVVKVTS